jgi:hypothetical protein
MEEKKSINLGYGFFMDNDSMKDYVNFICDQIEKIKAVHCGTTVNKSDGFPMKGYYVPVKLEIIERLSRSADIKIEVLGHTKQFIFFMSRHKSPDETLHRLQSKIDELTLDIIKENSLDQDKIFSEYHPLRNYNGKMFK